MGDAFHWIRLPLRPNWAEANVGGTDGEWRATHPLGQSPTTPAAVWLTGLTRAHPGQIVAIASGVAYLVGYVNLRVMTAGLGVAVSDLGLNTEDYVVTTVLWLLATSPVIAAYAFVSRLARNVGWRSLTGYSLSAGAVGVAATVVVFVARETPGIWWLATVLVIGIIGAGGWLIGRQGLAVVATVAAAVAALTSLGSFAWGSQLGQDPAIIAPAPLSIEVVVSVEEGTAFFVDGPRCARRLSDRIYVTSTAVRIEPAAVPFQPGSCFSTP